jgi:hypothetical protein
VARLEGGNHRAADDAGRADDEDAQSYFSPSTR